MKIKDLMVILKLENRISIRKLLMLLPVFQARLDKVARWGAGLCIVTNLFTKGCIADKSAPFCGQGGSKPVKHKLGSAYGREAAWTGCPNFSWMGKNRINFGVQKLWEVS